MSTNTGHLSGIGGAVRSPAPGPQLRSPAAAGSPQLRETFTEFVGQTFFGELLKQMRATVDKPSFLHGGFGEDVFQSQLDQVLVERMTEASGPSFSGPMFDLMMARR
jgi:flagellar protein FlgJ